MPRRASQKVSSRQVRILEFIEQRIAENGYPPSIREIAEACGLKSASTVHGHLSRLERKGYLRRDPAKSRAIELLRQYPGWQGLQDRQGPRDQQGLQRDPGGAFNKTATLLQTVVSIPVVGKVAAGAPILAEENIEEYIAVPRAIASGERLFSLRVRGNSMVNAGILDGDYVVVRQQDSVDNGDIAVALLGNEATVKRFYKEDDKIRLQPENPYMEPIITREVTILGKVVGLLRKL
ncbi:MAG TPA: transcriptional repressor LexA [Firmicutes bacterium]|nr:transcriptional repressor LexA [Bacillota bacterium]